MTEDMINAELVQSDDNTEVVDTRNRLFSTGDLSFADLAEMDGYAIVGHSSVDKTDLIGIPHIITAATFWVPKKEQRGFVSLEAVVADEKTLSDAVRRRWVSNIADVSALFVSPNESVVYNDGSTGIRRQIVTILHSLKLLNVGDTSSADAFDRPWPEWESFAETREQGPGVEVPSFTRNPHGRQLVIKVGRGLRVSQYSNDYADEAETFYLS